jgi:hypothetical protein
VVGRYDIQPFSLPLAPELLHTLHSQKPLFEAKQLHRLDQLSIPGEEELTMEFLAKSSQEALRVAIAMLVTEHQPLRFEAASVTTSNSLYTN